VPLTADKRPTILLRDRRGRFTHNALRRLLAADERLNDPPSYRRNPASVTTAGTHTSCREASAGGRHLQPSATTLHRQCT
jgi:hypothetical protein